MIKIAIESVEPFVKRAVEGPASNIPLYNTQAEMQLLSKLRSQSYRAYISGLAQLPDKDISEKMSLSDIDISRTEDYLPVSSLLPTQSQIYVDAVIPKITVDRIDEYFPGGSNEVEIGMPIVTFNRRFVIDGHHRWAGAAIMNPKAKISVVDFSSDVLTPIQFLKLLQGAIVMEKGELPAPPKDEYTVDLFHSSKKDIQEYIEETVDFDLLDAIKEKVSLASTEEVLTYLCQNAFTIKYNNLPAVSSPSRELMPQTDNEESVLDSVVTDAPVLGTAEDK